MEAPADELNNLDLLDVADQYLAVLQDGVDLDGEFLAMEAQLDSQTEMISNIFASQTKLHEQLVRNGKTVHAEVCKNMGSKMGVPFVKTKHMTRKHSENIAARTEKIVFMEKNALELNVKEARKEEPTKNHRKRSGSKSVTKPPRKSIISP